VYRGIGEPTLRRGTMCNAAKLRQHYHPLPLWSAGSPHPSRNAFRPGF